MWSTEYVTETDLPPAAVWAAIRDQHSGVDLGGGDTFRLHGPFAVGSTLSVTPQGQETFTSTIT